MWKNPTPFFVAIFTATVSVLGFFLLLILFDLYHHYSHNYFYYIQLAIVLGIFIFFSSFFLIKKYITRRIKLIYKSIYTQKLSALERSGKGPMYKANFEEVEKEVAEWSAKQQNELIAMKELEEYRRNFLGNVSHELKTPIFNIQGYIYTLLEGGINDSKINKHYLQRAAKNIDRLQSIVSDLQSISKLESGKMILDIQEFDIKELVKEVIDENEMLALKKSIIVGFKPGSDQSYKVKADRESIRTVLTNLIQNSIKYGQKTGKTLISFYNMEIKILVEITDTGVGIPENQIKHVFDRFYRVDSGRSRDEGGTGLGLSIVKHIIEAHHQTINVRSTVGVGSTFGFTLDKA